GRHPGCGPSGEGQLHLLRVEGQWERPALLHRERGGVQPAGGRVQRRPGARELPQLTAGDGEPTVKQLAVLGHPVSHSRSPAMQGAALEALGLGGEWSYGEIDVDPVEFDERVRGLAGEGYVGANVTIPHKEAALQVADETSEAAREIGAANTLTFRGQDIRADNTDATGLLAALSEPIEGKAALVLGAGGS